MIRVVSDKQKAIEAGYESLKDRLQVDKEDFEKMFQGYEFQAFMDEEVPVGMMISKGPEIHVAVLPQYRNKWLSRRLINSVINPLIKKYGYIKTMVMKDNLKGMDFVERLGFEKTGFKNNMIFYRKSDESTHEDRH